MAGRNKELLYNLELRIKQLIFLCDSLKSENMELKQLLATSEESRVDLEERLKQLEQDYDNLKFANSFVSDNEKNVAKERLLQLVQDVDKCISLLKY